MFKGVENSRRLLDKKRDPAKEQKEKAIDNGEHVSDEEHGEISGSID